MTWANDAIFYHIYPLGLCDAPATNDFASAPVPRLEKLYAWLDHLQQLGCNALLLGPIFESTAHGYDTADYFQIDRRLGQHNTFKALAGEIKSRGLRLVLDGVFNHVGRNFWAFQDVQQHGAESLYSSWFHGLNFDQRSPYGDFFSYEGWSGHYDLVKLNLQHPAVREHLFSAVTMWIQEFDIDGLRLDAADHIDPEFLAALAHHCRHLKPDFWLMGEVVHGDYRRWANPTMLDATTNYECYKGLYSSHVDKNYFEIAYSLNRLFGESGLYRGLWLYNFADNHDVNRVASSLTHTADLYPLYGLLFTMPGIPSIYYGSEWGIEGVRTPNNDKGLRPALDLCAAFRPQPALEEVIQQLATIRLQTPALRYGDYHQLHVSHRQFAFQRVHENQKVIVAINAADTTTTLSLHGIQRARDILNGNEICNSPNLTLFPHWLRILLVEA